MHMMHVAVVVVFAGVVGQRTATPPLRHAASVSATTATGDWAGIIDIAGHQSAVQAHLYMKGDSATGSMDLYGDATGVNLRGVRLTSDSIVATIPLRLTGPTTIRGRIAGDTLVGVAERGDRTGTVRLLHLVPIDTAAAHRSEGLYVVGADTLIVNRVAPTMLALTEPTTHALRILAPVGPGEYVAGTTLFSPVPISWRIRIRNEDSVSAALIVTRDGRTVTARRVPLHVEEVRFTHDTITLGGAFIRPPQASRYPVVVFMHGSGNSIRTSHLGIAYYLAAHGIASLIYDKRGTPPSTGVYITASYADLADDAVAGASMLMSRPDVDTMHVGFAGISEGANTSMLAAARFRKTAFVIPISGAGLGPNVWELYEAADQLVTDGSFTAADTAEAMHFLRARDHYAATRRDWPVYEAALKRAIAPGPRWYGYATTDLFGWGTPDSRGWDQKALNYFYDPIPAARMLTCPVLNILGERDVPAANAISVPLLKRALAEAGDTDVTFRILPGVNHNLFITTSGNEHEMDRVSGFSPEYFPLVLEWLTRVVRDGGGNAHDDR